MAPGNSKQQLVAPGDLKGEVGEASYDRQAVFPRISTSLERWPGQCAVSPEEMSVNRSLSVHFSLLFLHSL